MVTKASYTRKSTTAHLGLLLVNVADTKAAQLHINSDVGSLKVHTANIFVILLIRFLLCIFSLVHSSSRRASLTEEATNVDSKEVFIAVRTIHFVL